MYEQLSLWPKRRFVFTVEVWFKDDPRIEDLTYSIGRPIHLPMMTSGHYFYDVKGEITHVREETHA